jgi:hypothetical protein
VSARPLAEAVEAGYTIAQEMFLAAHRRFALAQTITAGWDSRLSLAASRVVSPDVMYFTTRHWDMPEDYRDVVVPARVLPTLPYELERPIQALGAPKRRLTVPDRQGHADKE